MSEIRLTVEKSADGEVFVSGESFMAGRLADGSWTREPHWFVETLYEFFRLVTDPKELKALLTECKAAFPDCPVRLE